MVVQPTDLISSILENAKELAKDDESVRIVLIHGDRDDPNMLEWSGPFTLSKVEEELEDSWELLAGAAIVFEEFGEVTMNMIKQDGIPLGS